MRIGPRVGGDQIEQPDLLTWAERQRDAADHNTIRAAFEEFHARHPEVYAMFERFSLEMLAGGLNLGAKAVWERMRWETRVGPLCVTTRTYRLNNNFTPYYARLFMARHPEHAHAFHKRRVRS